MNPDKVIREHVRQLSDLPNIGKAMAEDLQLIGIRAPEQLVGKDPFEMYTRLCNKTATRQDPCVIDVFISIVRFMNGEPARPWWAYTAERKQAYPRR